MFSLEYLKKLRSRNRPAAAAQQSEQRKHNSEKKPVAPIVPKPMIHTRELHVVLDVTFVEKYLSAQKIMQDLTKQFSMMSLNSDFDMVQQDEANDSVVFVGEVQSTNDSVEIVAEEIASQEYSAHFRKMNKKIAALKTNNRRLAVQKSALEKQAKNATIVVSDDENLDVSLQLSESFVEKQVGEWRDNGELSQILNEFQQFIIENIDNAK